MKILGKSENGYILETSKDELANLVGYYGGYDDKFRTLKIEAGCQIKISDMFKQLYNLQRKQPELQKMCSTLRTLADLLEPVVPVIESTLKTATHE